MVIDPGSGFSVSPSTDMAGIANDVLLEEPPSYTSMAIPSDSMALLSTVMELERAYAPPMPASTMTVTATTAAATLYSHGNSLKEEAMPISSLPVYPHDIAHGIGRHDEYRYHGY